MRVLTGPNLYFPRPTVKLTLDARAAFAADAGTVLGWQQSLRIRGSAVGLPDSPTRAAAIAELAATLVRRAGARLRRRVAAVGAQGDDGTVIVAFPFRHLGTAQALAQVVAGAFDAITTGADSPARALARVAPAMAGLDPGETVTALRPTIPVIAVTGTNGKTTTTRLIAHLLTAAGHTPGWSSTDGIVIDGQTVETGDWSGPGGAARVLSDPSVTIAVTETARGGILLRGVGTAYNDVSVVTNISADHLGLLGVHTVEELARVKSVVPRITKASGYAVLNADDPLVLAMRAVTRARPWLYSPDPTNEHLAEALDVGGRAITVLDGAIVVLRRGLDPTEVIDVAAVPLTLGGSSRVNLSNALAAAAAALAAGASLRAVRAGLASFTSSAEHNAGRLNVYQVGDTAVVLDLAHNEASLASLLEVARALRLPDGELSAVVSTPGDRPDEAIHAMGAMAAGAADRLVIAGKSKYLRGRDAAELDALWMAGAAEAGVTSAVRTVDELAALIGLLDSGLPAGSAIAVCALEQRPELMAEIARRGGHEMTPAEVAARVADAEHR